MNKSAILAIVVIYLSVLIVNYPSVAAMSKNGSLPNNSVKSSSPANTGKKNESKRSVKNIEKPASSPKVNVRKQPIPTTPKNKVTVKDIGKTIQSRPKTNKNKQKSLEKRVETTQRFPKIGSGNTEPVQMEKGIVKIMAQIPEGMPPEEMCHGNCYATGFIVGVINNTIYIITVSHAVSGDPTPRVLFYGDPQWFTAKIEQAESDTNGIALLSVTNPSTSAIAIQQLPIADKFDLKPRDSVAVAGFPIQDNSIAHLYLSYSHRVAREELFSGSEIQGISGSPIIKENNVVGMVTSARQGFVKANSSVIVYYFLSGYSNGVLTTGQQKKNTISSPLPTPSVPIPLPEDKLPKAEIVAFATARGKTAGDDSSVNREYGIYTKFLSQEIQKTQNIEEAFRNVSKLVEKHTHGDQKPELSIKPSLKNVFFCFGGCSGTVSNSVRQFALVIGNNEYEGALPRDSINNAKSIADLLGKKGFEVTLLTDAGFLEMETAVQQFAKRTLREKNSVGLFYFSGDSISAKGNDYLIPSDFGYNSKRYDMSHHAISVKFVKNLMLKSKIKLKIIILDSSRLDESPMGSAIPSMFKTVSVH